MLKIAILAAFFVLTVTSSLYKKPCPKDVPIVKCRGSPCKGAQNAVCILTRCGVCKITCYGHNGQREFCSFEPKINCLD